MNIPGIFNFFNKARRRPLFASTLAAICVGCILCLQLPTLAGVGNCNYTHLIFTHSASLPPYSYIEDGTPKGLLVDWWKLWAKKTGVGITFKLAPFAETIRMVQTGQADVHMGLIQCPGRSRTLDFSKPIRHVRVNLFMDESMAVKNPKSLIRAGIPVGVVKGDYVHNFLRSNYPEMTFKMFDTSAELYWSAAAGETRAFAKDTYSFLYASSRLGQEGEMIPAKHLFTEDLRAAATKAKPGLVRLLNHGMDLMTKVEKEEIFNRWIPCGTNRESWIWKNIITILAGLGLIALIIHALVLRFQVRKKTRQLQETLGKLTIQEEKYRGIFENAAEGIFVSTKEGRLVEANKAMATIFGFDDANELREFTDDHGIKMLYLDPKERKSVVMAIFAYGGVSNQDIRVTRKDGKTFWARLNATPVKDGDRDLIEGMLQDVTREKEAEQSLIFRATRDALTGLPNRYLFEDRFSHALAGAKRHDRKIALLFIDLNDFKLVNDSHGHHVGDALLKSLSERLRARIRESDTCARLGGDEFAVILEDVGDKEEIARTAMEMKEIMTRPYNHEDRKVTIGTSIGIAVYPDDTQSQESLIQLADKAMYLSKSQKTPYVFASDIK